MSASRRAEIVAAARGWLGVKWRHQGRSRLGIDCIGLPAVIGAELGFEVQDHTVYAREPKPAQMLATLRANGCQQVLPVTKRQAGDILLFRDGQQVRHAGILSEKHGVEHVIHATAVVGQVIEQPLIGDMLDRLVYAFSFPGVE